MRAFFKNLKAQEDAEKLRSVVMPMEQEIASLKSKLATAEERVKELEASKVEPPGWRNWHCWIIQYAFIAYQIQIASIFFFFCRWKSSITFWRQRNRAALIWRCMWLCWTRKSLSCRKMLRNFAKSSMMVHPSHSTSIQLLSFRNRPDWMTWTNSIF